MRKKYQASSWAPPIKILLVCQSLKSQMRKVPDWLLSSSDRGSSWLADPQNPPHIPEGCKGAAEPSSGPETKCRYLRRFLWTVSGLSIQCTLHVIRSWERSFSYCKTCFDHLILLLGLWLLAFFSSKTALKSFFSSDKVVLLSMFACKRYKSPAKGCCSGFCFADLPHHLKTTKAFTLAGRFWTKFLKREDSSW